MTAKERILKYIDTQGVSNRQFCITIAVSHTYFSVKGAISSDILAKIFTRYPEINMDWVITGRGEMLYSNSNAKQAVNAENFEKKYYALLEKYNHCLEVSQKKKVS